MGARPLTPMGQQFMAALPPVLQGSCDYQACMHALAREIELLEASIEVVRSQFNPSSADLLLPAWETMAKLPVGGAGASIAQRRQAVVQRLQKVLGSSEGRQWEAQITALVGQGWTYREHVAGDATTPAANTLEITLPMDPTSQAFAQAQVEIRELTAAHLDIVFLTSAAFRLDSSELDVGQLAY